MMVAAEPIVSKKKLKIKFGSKTVAEFARELPADGCGCKKYEHAEASSSESCSMQGARKKRGPYDGVEGPPKKKLKMDRNITRQCSLLLRGLMEHRLGWVFNQPVDPVKLNIPDYFSVISYPMDLGTIKSKLGKNMYHGIEEFTADIRLTFSNAMLYNPPGNEVHQMAKTLKELFEVRWKSLEQKLKLQLPKILAIAESGMSGRNDPGTPDVSENLQPNGFKKAPLNARPLPATAKIKIRKMDQSPASNVTVKRLDKGANSGGRLACGSDEAKQPESSATSKSDTSDGNMFRRTASTLTCASSSDITTEKACPDNASDSCTMSCRAKSMSASKMSKSDPDSDGAVSSVDDENTCPSSQATVPATDAEFVEGWTKPVPDVQMSPKKALRAAMIKSRFSDTILKAKQRTLLDHTNKADPLKLQQEKERLEKMHREEKARIQAEIREAEAASRLRAETELKERRERQREEARTALQKMVKTVDVEDNLEAEWEVEMMFGFKEATDAYKEEAYLLDKLGLFRKDDQMLDESEDCEEGEIFT